MYYILVVSARGPALLVDPTGEISGRQRAHVPSLLLKAKAIAVKGLQVSEKGIEKTSSSSPDEI